MPAYINKPQLHNWIESAQIQQEAISNYCASSFQPAFLRKSLLIMPKFTDFDRKQTTKYISNHEKSIEKSKIISLSFT
jgi:hypothetical protein